MLPEQSPLEQTLRLTVLGWTIDQVFVRDFGGRPRLFDEFGPLPPGPLRTWKSNSL